MAKSGLLKLLEEKTGKSVSQIKSAIMKSATHVYRKMKEILGVTHMPVEAYYEVLRHALPIAWKIVREEHRIPTPDDVFKLVTEEWPTWKEDLQRYLASVKAK